jgi:cytochrome c6
MRRKLLLFIVLLLLIHSYASPAQEPAADGRQLFRNKCVRCHGRDGTRGFLGAKNLQLSDRDDNSIYTIIREGRNVMPSWKKQLKPAEISLLVRYVKTLRITIP